jgi:hypothetical protein
MTNIEQWLNLFFQHSGGLVVAMIMIVPTAIGAIRKARKRGPSDPARIRLQTSFAMWIVTGTELVMYVFVVIRSIWSGEEVNLRALLMVGGVLVIIWIFFFVLFKVLQGIELRQATEAQRHRRNHRHRRHDRLQSSDIQEDK